MKTRKVTIEESLDRMRLEKQIEDRIEATTEVAKTGTADELLESLKELLGLKCRTPQIEAKFATLHKVLNERTC